MARRQESKKKQSRDSASGKSDTPKRKSGKSEGSSKSSVDSSKSSNSSQPGTQRKSAGQESRAPITVVGIGASAGGLEALEGFFAEVKAGQNLAYVVVQHRAADRTSVMVDLLARRTALDVKNIEDGMAIRPDCIYLNPPHHEVSISGGTLHCRQAKSDHGAQLPIDYFFRALADGRGERAVCVVLSGTGSDGTLGLKEIKAKGGLAVAQLPEQAKYRDMPQNAIDTGQVDFVLPVEEMAEKIVAYLKHPLMEHVQEPVTGETGFERALVKLFALMRENVGHDFSKYKRSTICRRLQHRMALHHIEDIEQYVRYAREKPDELRGLFKDWTITVTSFFRGKEAFESLKSNAVDRIVADKPLDVPVRVWVPGCATGEEAYSVAILIEESLESHDLQRDVQVFATDIDEEAIELARLGSYPENIAADLSKERLDRFFVHSKKGYRIKQRIRDNVVFARQDLIGDPPFSRLDLVCCRNVLIYMGRDLQNRIIPLFHYTLTTGGYLFLGNSETAGECLDLFVPVDMHNRIYRAIGQRTARPAGFTVPSARTRSGARPLRDDGQAERKSDSFVSQAERLILRDYSQPCVLVNSDLEIVYFNGDTSAFLAQVQGEPTTSVLKLARPPLHYELSMLLRQVQKEQRAVACKKIVMSVAGEPATVTVTVRSLSELSGNGDLMIVVFDAGRQPEQAEIDRAEDEDPESNDAARIRELEQELSSTKEYLQTTIEELETSNEELQSSNEELQSTNEELQSTNEELETSREELQSVNEELRTVNASHEQHLTDLSGANDDLSNLLNSTETATIFLDTQMKVRRFTPMARQIFKLIELDVGRPLSDISHCLDYDGLLDDAKDVLDTLRESENLVRAKDGRELRVRITPYRTANNVIDGVVIVAVDITSEVRARNYAEAIVETVRCPLVVLDSSVKVVSANRVFYDTFETTAEQTEGRSLYQLGSGQWDIPKLRELLECVLPENSVVEDFVVDHDFPDIGRRTMVLNARRMVKIDGEDTRILLAVEDRTERGLTPGDTG